MHQKELVKFADQTVVVIAEFYCMQACNSIASAIWVALRKPSTGRILAAESTRQHILCS